MERGSSKHGPRLDDEMAHETAGIVQSHGPGGRAEEWHDPEPSGEDQPEVTYVPGGQTRGGTPPGLDPDDVEPRSRLGRFLDRSVFPADAAQLRHNAVANQAPADILTMLGQLPNGRHFKTVTEVWAALGGSNEERRW